MKRKIACIILMLFASSLLSFPAFASSLNDVVTQNQTAAATASASNPAASPAGNMIDDLSGATDMSESRPEVSKITSNLGKIVGIVIQVLSWGITVGLTVVTLLDLAYISIPFVRSPLANGHMGNAQAGAGTSPMGGMGGMGMGGLGGGFGGGFGGGLGGGFGGGLGRFGGGMGMGGLGGGMMGGAQQGQIMPGRMQFVTNAALNAVASETTVGPDGKAGSPMRYYIKHMTVTLALTPILLTLAITGVLTRFGFMLGGLIAGGISGANLGGF